VKGKESGEKAKAPSAKEKSANSHIFLSLPHNVGGPFQSPNPLSREKSKGLE
jgi:hypothetical protein